jgi:hypothetical protein
MRFFHARVLMLLLVMLLLITGGNVAHAQDPTPTPPPPVTLPGGLQIPGTQELDKVYAIVQMVTDLVQGKVTPNPDSLFQQANQGASDLLNQPGAGIFFLDFADPH